MKLVEALKAKREKILSTWIDRTLDSYTSSGFFKKAKDKFANPVGGNIKEGLSALFDLLCSGAKEGEYTKPLDQVIRIRAVQEFTPAQAVAPILELKWVVRQILSEDKGVRELLTDLDAFDCDVDRAALAAFNIYSECRERLYRTRIRELQSGTSAMIDGGCPSRLLDKQGMKLPRVS
jgi:hypothetical protein